VAGLAPAWIADSCERRLGKRTPRAGERRGDRDRRIRDLRTVPRCRRPFMRRRRCQIRRRWRLRRSGATLAEQMADGAAWLLLHHDGWETPAQCSSSGR